MQKFILELFLTLHGIGAASGISYTNDALYVIADNSNALYRYDLLTQNLETTALIGTLQDGPIPKAEKSDFESICLRGEELLILGSGSTAKRNSLIRYNIQTKELQQEDLTTTYSTLQNNYHIDQDNFNIEGLISTEQELWLFNRGNGMAQKNGIFVIDADSYAAKGYYPIALPEIDGVATSFTDALLYEGDIYILAAAEDATSTYHDGEIKGSILAVMNLQDKTIKETTLISSTHKFEGISALKKTDHSLSFVLCEDKDDDGNETDLYTLTLQR